MKKVLILSILVVLILSGFVLIDTAFAEKGGKGDPPGKDKVLICHKPGTPAEKEMSVPEPALGGHIGHGDNLGSCISLPEPTPTDEPPTPAPTQPTPTDEPPTPAPPTKEPVPTKEPEEVEPVEVEEVEEIEEECECCCNVEINVEGDVLAPIIINCGDNNEVIIYPTGDMVVPDEGTNTAINAASQPLQTQVRDLEIQSEIDSLKETVEEQSKQIENLTQSITSLSTMLLVLFITIALICFLLMIVLVIYLVNINKSRGAKKVIRTHQS